MNDREISRAQIQAGQQRAAAFLARYSRAELDAGEARDAIRAFILECASNPNDLGIKAATHFIEAMYSERVDLSICKLVGSSRDPEAMTTIVKNVEVAPRSISHFIYDLRNFAQRFPDMFAQPSPVGSDDEAAEEIAPVPPGVPSSDELSSLASAPRRGSESSGGNSFSVASSVEHLEHIDKGNTLDSTDLLCSPEPAVTMTVLGESE